jgi:glutamate transport system permease protein
MSGSSVLYDSPGPRTRRNTRIGSAVGTLVVLGLVAVVVKRLADAGQFETELWAPLLDPDDEVFRDVWNLLREGFANTLKAAAISILLSLLLGTLLGMLRLSLPGAARWPVVGLIELLRGLPVVLAVFGAYVILPELGLPLPNIWYLVIGLTAYNSVIIAEILRAGVNSLPRGQREAGLAIGLTPLQTLSQVQLPQAFRVMLPALISQLVVVLKDTTLAAVALAGFVEALNTSKVVYQNLDNPIQVYTVVGVIFIAVNYALSRLAVWVERRLSHRSSGKHIDPAAAVTVGAPDMVPGR